MSVLSERASHPLAEEAPCPYQALRQTTLGDQGHVGPCSIPSPLPQAADPGIVGRLPGPGEGRAGCCHSIAGRPPPAPGIICPAQDDIPGHKDGREYAPCPYRLAGEKDPHGAASVGIEDVLQALSVCAHPLEVSDHDSPQALAHRCRSASRKIRTVAVSLISGKREHEFAGRALVTHTALGDGDTKAQEHPLQLTV